MEVQQDEDTRYDDQGTGIRNAFSIWGEADRKVSAETMRQLEKRKEGAQRVTGSGKPNAERKGWETQQGVWRALEETGGWGRSDQPDVKATGPTGRDSTIVMHPRRDVGKVMELTKQFAKSELNPGKMKLVGGEKTIYGVSQKQTERISDTEFNAESWPFELVKETVKGLPETNSRNVAEIARTIMKQGTTTVTGPAKQRARTLAKEAEMKPEPVEKPVRQSQGMAKSNTKSEEGRQRVTEPPVERAEVLTTTPPRHTRNDGDFTKLFAKLGQNTTGLVEHTKPNAGPLREPVKRTSGTLIEPIKSYTDTTTKKPEQDSNAFVERDKWKSGSAQDAQDVVKPTKQSVVTPAETAPGVKYNVADIKKIFSQLEQSTQREEVTNIPGAREEKKPTETAPRMARNTGGKTKDTWGTKGGEMEQTKPRRDTSTERATTNIWRSGDPMGERAEPDECDGVLLGPSRLTEERLAVFSEPCKINIQDRGGGRTISGGHRTLQPGGVRKVEQGLRTESEPLCVWRKHGARVETEQADGRGVSGPRTGTEASHAGRDTVRGTEEEANHGARKMTTMPAQFMNASGAMGQNETTPRHDYLVSTSGKCTEEKKVTVCFCDNESYTLWTSQRPSRGLTGFVNCMRLSHDSNRGWRTAIATSFVVAICLTHHSQHSMDDVYPYVESYIDELLERWRPGHSGQHKAPIGIFSRDGGKWLQMLRNRYNTVGHRKKVRYIDILRATGEKIREEMARCSFPIIYVTEGNVRDLHHLSQEMRKVLVVTQNFVERSVREMSWILGEVSAAARSKSLTEQTGEGSCLTSKNLIPQTSAPRTVGIFSRSAQSHYEWLQRMLQSDKFKDHIQYVHAFYILNNKFQLFKEDVSRCSVGILYHTKNRGGINVTDVTDSLYDEELVYMSKTLGRGNVLVVIDDLEDIRGNDRLRLLTNQPSIEVYAGNLLLVSEMEKNHEDGMMEKLLRIQCFNNFKPRIGL